VRFGTNCFGTAAFRPADFAGVFEELVLEIRAVVTMPARRASETSLAQNFLPMSIGVSKSKVEALAV
jgi:hypothetical protein